MRRSEESASSDFLPANSGSLTLLCTMGKEKTTSFEIIPGNVLTAHVKYMFFTNDLIRVNPKMDCYESNVLIFPTGKVLWVPPCTLKSYCNLTIAEHPMKEQVCTLKFGNVKIQKWMIIFICIYLSLVFFCWFQEAGHLMGNLTWYFYKLLMRLIKLLLII